MEKESFIQKVEKIENKDEQKVSENKKTNNQKLPKEEYVSKIRKKYWWCEIPYESLIFNLNEDNQQVQLGSGAYGKVFKGKYLGREVAIKKMNKDYFGDTEFIESARKEIRSLVRLRHQNIVTFYGFSQETGQKNSFFLVMEFVELGSLSDLLKECRQKNMKLSVENIFSLSKDIILGLNFVHGHKIIHRDLKIQNILVWKEKNLFRAKICDFGTGRITSTHSISKSLHSPFYCAPEISIENIFGATSSSMPYPPQDLNLIKKKNDSLISVECLPYSFKSDIYSLGVTLNTLVVGVETLEIPLKSFPKVDNEKLEFLVKIIKLCCEKNPKKRISLEEICELFICFECEFKFCEILFLNMCDVHKNYEILLKWCKILLKKNEDDYVSNHFMGYMFLDGKGVKKDIKKALNYYEKSSKFNYHLSNNHIGYMNHHGLGFKANYKKAMEYYQKAANQGNSCAQSSIGFLYLKGLGVEVNFKKAMEYFQKSSEKGNSCAESNIGYLYLKGLGVEIDFKKAMEYFQKSAEQGDSFAQINIGRLYEKGLGVKVNYEKAMEYFQKSAEQGNSVAQFNIGDMYQKGLGVEIDYKKAMEYYQKSAEQKNSDAQFRIGDMYLRGLGVEKDIEKANKYHQEAINYLSKNEYLLK